MAKSEKAGAKAAATGAAAAIIPEPITPGPVTEHEEIARLAYSYWEARGCPMGSPEEDWFRAERELQQRAAAAVA